MAVNLAISCWLLAISFTPLLTGRSHVEAIGNSAKSASSANSQ